jgi:transposase-like protein
MSDMQCPYCEADQEVCHDDGQAYDESARHEHRCTKCKKTFVFTTTICYHYEPAQADCLNGADHQLKMSKSYPARHSIFRCKDCDYERQPTAQEFASHGIDVGSGA